MEIQALIIRRPFEMDEEQQGNVLNSEFKLKDIAQFVGLIITGVWFIVTMNSKIDKLTDAVNDLKDTGSKINVATDLRLNNLQNQVSANSVQIELIKKDIDLFKKK